MQRRLFGNSSLGKQTSTYQVGACRQTLSLEYRTLVFGDSVSSVGSSYRAKVVFVFYLILCYFRYCYLFSSQSGHGLEAKIGPDGYKKCSNYSHISLTDLEIFPTFLRFDVVKLIGSESYDYGDSNYGKEWDTQSMDAKCKFLEDQLKLINPEVLDCSILYFSGAVDATDSSRFSDHSELLKYLSDRILPICDDSKPRGYHICIDIYLEVGIWSNVGRDIIPSLLQMPQINCCYDVQIRICSDADQIELPVKEISNWLHRKCDSQRERSLFINFCLIQNMMEMFMHLKKVSSMQIDFAEIFKNTFLCLYHKNYSKNFRNLKNLNLQWSRTRLHLKTFGRMKAPMKWRSKHL